MKARLGAVLLAAVSLAGSLWLGECAARALVDPLDFLKPDLVEDPILGHRVEPGSAGHDRWGFRNQEVPARAEIVTLGDSQTYGNNAPARSSWPSWLGQMDSGSTYNLGLGGYGPVEYRFLLEERALALDPSVVVVGVYLGNDLWDAERAVYRRPYWAALRDPGHVSPPPPPPSASKARIRSRAFASELKQWLGRRSVVYRMLTLHVGDRWRAMEARVLANPQQVVIEDEDGGIVTVLDPVYRERALDPDSPVVREGLRVTLDVLAQMRAVSDEAGVRLLVVLIPTKVSVFAPQAVDVGPPPAREHVARLAENEERLRRALEAGLDRLGIEHVSALEALRAAARERPLYLPNADGHPNGEGYRIIASVVHDRIQAGPPGPVDPDPVAEETP